MSSNLPATSPLDEKVGEAWIKLRARQPREALAMFESVLAEDARHIDALFGLGLTHRQNNNPAAARQVWEQALTIAQEELPEDNEPGVRFERIYMLQTMLQQRVEELSL